MMSFLFYKKNNKQSHGVTLIELVLVMVVFAILLFVGSRSAWDSLDRGRARETIDELKAIQKALIGDPRLVRQGDRVDFGYWGANANWPRNPDDGAGGTLANFVTDLTTPIQFLRVISTAAADIGTDGWGNNYIFDDDGSTEFTITSYGADGAAAGTDVNTDIVLSIRKDRWESNSIVIYVQDTRGTLLLPTRAGTDLATGHIGRVVFTENGGTARAWSRDAAGAASETGLTDLNNGFQRLASVPAGPCSVTLTIADGTGGDPYMGTYNWRPDLTRGAATFTQNFIIYPKGGADISHYQALIVKLPGAALVGFNEA